MKYIPRPREIEAVQFDGSDESYVAAVRFVSDRQVEGRKNFMQGALAAARQKIGGTVLSAPILRKRSDINVLEIPRSREGYEEVMAGEWVLFEDDAFRVMDDEAFRNSYIPAE